MEINELFGLEGRNVVITGAGSGMGYVAAKLLTQLGANVYATVRRNTIDFDVKKQIKVDLSNSRELDKLVAQLPDNIEALFLCHGIANAPGNANALEVQLTNFLSFKFLTEQLLPKVNNGGSITFISSNGGRTWRDSIQASLEVISCKTWDDALKWYDTNPNHTNDGYVFAKKCQHVYVASMVHTPKFIDRKIRLNAIAPGMTQTGLTDDFNKSINGDAEYGRTLLENRFLSFWNGRWASSEEMGNSLVAIGSKLFSYMSGQVIYIDYGVSSFWDFNDLKKENNLEGNNEL